MMVPARPHSIASSVHHWLITTPHQYSLLKMFLQPQLQKSSSFQRFQEVPFSLKSFPSLQPSFLIQGPASIWTWNYAELCAVQNLWCTPLHPVPCLHLLHFPQTPLPSPETRGLNEVASSLSQLWLATIIQQDDNEPSLWEQSKPNVCSADNVFHQKRQPGRKLYDRDKVGRGRRK